MHRKTYQAEQYALWRASFDTVTAKQVAQELDRPFGDKKIGLLFRIEQADNEAVGIYFGRRTDIKTRPYADRCDLRKTERRARDGGGLSIFADLRLPAWKGNIVPAWPVETSRTNDPALRST